ncbi:metal ABC transporter substrate-binding protein [Ruminococcus sp.]|uniref:metal ABC transporter substrate-binding protein n=1 Tax=Ruminococcus sp. TaxID=41978 RepID=UPI002600E454|nr:metal ABC transporter substrate-binding protein [Ruminococcus sp.]MBQ6252365.1 zinc ABC transporter substrate-binding protein [Ruminococcus sp.]
MAFFKRLFSAVIAAAAAALVLTGCSSHRGSEGKLSIVCVSFPEYDWTRQIVGSSDSAEITYLLGSGIDLHNYQPSAKDIMTISDCDIFMYVGGESDSWAKDALKEVNSKNTKVIKLMDVLGQNVKEEEHKEGMEPEEEDGHHDEPEYDEHVWLSLKNAEVICNEICDVLCEKDSANADTYRENLRSYTESLNSLDAEYSEMADSAETRTILFGDRFPFRYLCDDYDIDYYAAFAGCSAETAASFETVAKLSEKLNENKLDTVFIIENSDDSIARSIISNSGRSGVSIETLNSIQSVTQKDIDGGATYLSIMETNLGTLKKVLD